MSKGLEIFNKLLGSKGISNDEFEAIEKELKALEIIKNSGYISIDEMLSQNYITRKEYDLLKEVLICHW